MKNYQNVPLDFCQKHGFGRGEVTELHNITASMGKEIKSSASPLTKTRQQPAVGRIRYFFM